MSPIPYDQDHDTDHTCRKKWGLERNRLRPPAHNPVIHSLIDIGTLITYGQIAGIVKQLNEFMRQRAKKNAGKPLIRLSSQHRRQDIDPIEWNKNPLPNNSRNKETDQKTGQADCYQAENHFVENLIPHKSNKEFGYKIEPKGQNQGSPLKRPGLEQQTDKDHGAKYVPFSDKRLAETINNDGKIGRA